MICFSFSDIILPFRSGPAITRSVRLDAAQIPVRDEDERALRNLVRESLERMGMPAQNQDFILSNLAFGDHYPAFTSLLAGPYGTLWVQQAKPTGEVAEGEIDPQLVGDRAASALLVASPVWNVFARDGRHMGEIRFPERFRPLQTVGDRIYGVWRDDLNVQYVVRLRVTGAVPS